MSSDKHATGIDVVSECLRPDGNWIRELTPSSSRLRRAPAVFLDRDGVMIEERHYLRDPDQVEILPGCDAMLKAAKASGFLRIVVTNQSGIGRGYYDWHGYAAVEQRMLDLLAQRQVDVDAILACPYYEGTATLNDKSGDWRKPKPGMLLEAAERYAVVLGRSLIIGDKATDLEAGRAAGLAMGIHVATGHGHASERERAMGLPVRGFKVLECRNLSEATQFIGKI